MKTQILDILNPANNMLIHLTYKWNELDKNHQFGIKLVEGNNDTHFNWVWFYLGAHLKGLEPKNSRIYPFSIHDGKLIGSYRYHRADDLGKLLYNRMMKIHRLMEWRQEKSKKSVTTKLSTKR